MNYDRIIQGDCLEGMAQMDGSSVDLVVTDPPYGYSFMGKDWDKAVPSVDIWKECLRVLKPGAFAFIMSAPRLDVLTQMSVRVQEAGFDVAFTPLYWAYASGFPKAMNISKAVDKRLGADREVVGKNPNDREHRDNQLSDYGLQGGVGNGNITIPSTPQAKALDGSYAGFQPKPAVEVIIVAMKPLSEKTYIDQALTNGKGITWLDDGRIPYRSDNDKESTLAINSLDGKSFDTGRYQMNVKNSFIRSKYEPADGRFPANLLVSDDVLDDGKKHIGTGGLRPQKPSPEWSPFHEETNRPYFNYGDSGGFSRYFSLDKWAETLPFLIVPKASKGEKNKGCDGLEGTTKCGAYGDGIGNVPKINGERPTSYHNFHPTVKPLKLMSYLITLGSRPGDTILDPFAGSGTVGIAARKLARHFIGFELSEQYHEISVARTRDAIAQRSLIDFGEEVNDYRHKTPTKGQVKE